MVDRSANFALVVTGLMWARVATAQAISVLPPGGQLPPSSEVAASRRVDQVTSRTTSTHIAPVYDVTDSISGTSVTIAQPPKTTSREKSGTSQVARPRLREDESRDTHQLTSSKRTIDAGLAISRPSEGRRQTVVRLAGSDRCDPAAVSSTSASPTCRRVIENRSEDYVRSDPNPLSPEQKILVDQRIRELPDSPEQAVQRIGRNEVDPESSADQGIAAIALRDAAPSSTTRESPSPTPADAAAAALVQAITAGNPTGATSGTGSVTINPR